MSLFYCLASLSSFAVVSTWSLSLFLLVQRVVPREAGREQQLVNLHCIILRFHGSVLVLFVGLQRECIHIRTVRTVRTYVSMEEECASACTGIDKYD